MMMRKSEQSNHSPNRRTFRVANINKASLSIQNLTALSFMWATAALEDFTAVYIK